MARKTRREMSGVFDYFKKKKKEEEQKSLWELVVPPTAPSHPASQPEEKSLIDYFRPKSNLPAKAEPKKSFLPSFDFLVPKEKKAAPRPLSILPEVTLPKAEKPKKPLEEGFKEVFKGPPETKQRYVFLNPSRPPEGIPIRPYGLPAPATAPVMEWTLPTPSQLATHFRKTMNLPAMWDEIRRIRALPEFKKDQLIYSWQGVPMMIPLDPVVYQEVYTDYANFYGIPWNVMSMYITVPEGQQKAAEEALMNNVISPLNAMVPEAFDLLRPADIPGFFNVTFTEPAGEYWLFYIEPKLEGLLPPGGSGGS